MRQGSYDAKTYLNLVKSLLETVLITRNDAHVCALLGQENGESETKTCGTSSDIAVLQGRKQEKNA